MNDDLREATLADLAILVRHRRLMFEDIEASRDRMYPPEGWQAADDLYSHFVEDRLPCGTFHAWLIEVDGEVVASGAISIVDWPPSPLVPTDQAAYLHSMYTCPAYRGQGFARRIVQAAIDYCRAHGIRRITLGASDAGRPLYESLGFQSNPRSMSLILDPP